MHKPPCMYVRYDIFEVTNIIYEVNRKQKGKWLYNDSSLAHFVSLIPDSVLYFCEWTCFQI